MPFAFWLAPVCRDVQSAFRSFIQAIHDRSHTHIEIHRNWQASISCFSASRQQTICLRATDPIFTSTRCGARQAWLTCDRVSLPGHGIMAHARRSPSQRRLTQRSSRAWKCRSKQPSETCCGLRVHPACSGCAVLPQEWNNKACGHIILCISVCC